LKAGHGKGTVDAEKWPAHGAAVARQRRRKKWLEEEGEPDRWGPPVGDRREGKSWWAAGRETGRKRREVGLLG
jgi:hypothetical protein